jgi:hypothetical protein
MEVQEAKFKVIGTRPIRHDGVDKVTGRARYGADISLPGMLHAKYCVARMRMPVLSRLIHRLRKRFPE